MRQTGVVLAAVALFCCASLALAALDCSSIPGCTACSYVDKNNKGQVLMCTACSTPAYVLKPKKGRCDCADGSFSRYPNGTMLDLCTSVNATSVAAGGPINDNSNIVRACLANSAPDASKASCLCLPGFSAVVGGQTPRCAACLGTTYTDSHNTRMQCKLCPVGKVANAQHTGCVAVADALSNVTSKVSSIASLSQIKSTVTSKINSTITGVTTKLNSTLTTVTGKVSHLPLADLKNKTAISGELSKEYAKIKANVTHQLDKIRNETAKSAAVGNVESWLENHGLALPNISFVNLVKKIG